MLKNKIGKIIIPAGVHPWPHELRVAEILAEAGHKIEFIPTGNISTADIYLDGVEFEIKSPLTNKIDKIERNIKRALKQSCNVIIDSKRIKGLRDDKLLKILTDRVRRQKQIKRLILISKQDKIIDVSKML